MASPLAHSPVTESVDATSLGAEIDSRPLVLVVEDESSYQDALEVGLSFEGFNVMIAGTLAEARELLARETPNLVLLDIMLPDGSGIDFCREIYDAHHLPIIIVSALDGEVNVVLGLEIGAADYVTKPYRLRELVARMRAILRRPPLEEASTETVTFGGLTIDFARHTLFRGTEEIKLSRKEFELLALFAHSIGQVVTREVCLDTLWWGLELSDTRTLDTHVKRLRQKIERDSSDPQHLITVRGIGFRLDR